MVVLGIDPGRSGAVACLSITEVQGSPKMSLKVDLLSTWSHLTLYDQLANLAVKYHPDYIFVEKVGTGQPGNSARSTTSFARHCGSLDMAVELIGREWEIPVTHVIPTKWMEDTVGGARPKGKGNRLQRKKYIREVAEYLIGEKLAKLDHADAVMIAVYGMRQVYGR